MDRAGIGEPGRPAAGKAEQGTAPPRALQRVARSGYAARGVVYLIIGGFALLAAFGNGDTTDAEGALSTILAQPFGRGLLAAMVAGLLAHAGWRLVQALADADNHGLGPKGLVVRGGLMASAVIHAALAVFAVSLMLGWNRGGGGGGDPTGEWIAAAVEAGWGRALAVAIALVPFGVGGAMIAKGVRAGFDKHLRAPEAVLRRLRPVCQIGLVARGLVFVTIGVLIGYGNAVYDTESAPGLKDALEAIQAMPMGWVLLGAMACGLVAFAVYSFVEAAYRRVDLH